MKRWITLLLATVVLLMAAGCGEKTEKLPDASLENPQITASQPDTSSPSTTAPADTPEAEESRILIAYFTWADNTVVEDPSAVDVDATTSAVFWPPEMPRKLRIGFSRKWAATCSPSL